MVATMRNRFCPLFVPETETKSPKNKQRVRDEITNNGCRDNVFIKDYQYYKLRYHLP